MSEATTKVFKAKEGSRISNKAAAECGAELERAFGERWSKGGAVKPKEIVEVARDAASYPALNSQLEWDNEKAAEKWREEQASHLVRSIVVEYREEGGGEIKMRPMVLSIQDGQGYFESSAVIDDVAMAERYEKICFEELSRFYKKYAGVRRMLGKVEPLMVAIEEAIPNLKVVRNEPPKEEAPEAAE